MDSTEEVRKLLTEIRDAQRDHLAEYKRVTQQSLEVQRRSFEYQVRIGRFYRFVVMAAGVVVAAVLAYLVYLFSKTY
jgi:hypothetical protein